MLSRFLLIGAILLLATSTDCGFIDAVGDPGAPLWTLQGRVEEYEPGMEIHALRAALVWTCELDNPVWAVSNNGILQAPRDQDLPLTQQFPANFTIELHFLPGYEVFIYPEEEPHVAVGVLMVYDDLNNNQHLDRLAPDARQPIDRLLGPKEKYRLLYADQPTVVLGLSIQAGLNLVRLHQEGEAEKLPLDSMLFVTLEDSEDIQHLMCMIPPDYSVVTQDLGEVPPEQIPQDAEIECDQGGRSLSFVEISILQEDDVCSPITERRLVGHSSLLPGQEPPASWPCET